MKRFLLPLVAISIALTSCSRDDDNIINPITNPVEQNTLLKKVSWANEPNFPREFSYDGDKLIGNAVHSPDTSYLQYQYTRDKITSIIAGQRESPKGFREFKFNYNSNGRLSTSIETVILDRMNHNTQQIITHTIISTREYSYVNPNTIKVKENFSIDGSNTTNEHTLTIENGNLVKKQQGNNITTYKYDNKINPLSKVKGLADISIDLELAHTWTDDINRGFANNLIQRDNGVAYIYEYNEKGYPTKRIWDDNLGNRNELIYSY